MTTLFISDLHLSGERPEINKLFLKFLSNEARQADALYILGDLFEYWIGDEAMAHPDQALAWMVRWVEPGGLLVLALSADQPDPELPEGVRSEGRHAYSGASGPRSAWFGRLESRDRESG